MSTLNLKYGCAVLALTLANTGWAQTPAAAADADTGVTDIIVTAQRRSENVQDVPIAVSAFSSDQLRLQGVSSALELGNFVPNLVAQNNTGLGSANAYYLRGLGNTETIPTFDPPVGTYVDDIYLSRQNANNLNLFDVEQVEVLRGPQGTLFGRNTTGGAINVILREPGKDFGGYAEVGYGRYNKKLARGSVDVPLAPTFSVKLSGYWQDDDGYVKNVTTGERLNDDDGWGARIGLHGDLSANVRWNASYAHIKADGENILNFDCNPAAPTQCDGRFATTGLRQTNPSSGSQFAGLAVPIQGRKANYPLGNRTDTDLVTSKLDIDLAPAATLSLITGYVSQIQQYALDFFDGRSGPTLTNPNPPILGFTRGGFTIINDGQAEQFSQEAKIAGSIGGQLIDYVAGVYYIKEDVKTDFADVFANSLTLGDRILRNSTEAIAGYVQGDLNLGIIKLTAGVRYTDEIKKISFRDNRPACQLTTAPTTCLFDQNFFVPPNGSTVLTAQPIPLRQQAKVWTPRFAVNVKPTDDLLLYVSATKGFKSGGWNARGYTPAGVLPFGPEKVWSYEAGLKAELFDRKLRANISVFQLDVTDLQTLSGIVNPVNGSISFVTRNFADYRNRGVEAEFTIVPVRGLNLFANVGYSNDKYILKANQPAFDQYGIQSVAGQLAACKAALAAGKVPGGPNVPATQPSIAACAAGIVTAQGTLASPVRTPDWTLAIGGSYRAELGGGMSIVPSVSGTYRSDQQVATSNLTIYTGGITGTNGAFNFNPNSGTPVIGSFSKAAWLVNAGLALNGTDDRWQLSVQCTNCFDKAYVQSALVNTTYLNPPMSWQVRGRVNF
jgi:iron complex outermembrane recepter protein